MNKASEHHRDIAAGRMSEFDSVFLGLGHNACNSLNLDHDEGYALNARSPKETKWPIEVV